MISLRLLVSVLALHADILNVLSDEIRDLRLHWQGVVALFDFDLEDEFLSEELALWVHELELDLVELFVVLGEGARYGSVLDLESERYFVVGQGLDLLEWLLDFLEKLLLGVVEDADEEAVGLVSVVSVVSHSNLELDGRRGFGRNDVGWCFQDSSSLLVVGAIFVKLLLWLSWFTIFLGLAILLWLTLLFLEKILDC